MVVSKLLLAIATIGLALPVQAAPAMFDFEDGEQGWGLFSGTRRAEISALGGSYAVFGTDDALLRLELDLTNIRSFTLEQLWLSPMDGLNNLVSVLVFGTDASGNSIRKRDRDGVSLIGDAANPFPNPDLRSFDISGFVGMGALSIFWNSLVSIPEDPCGRLNFIGYVDNITFHPVPEPGTLGLLAVGLAALVIERRRIV